MSDLKQFIQVTQARFPENRLTYQKGIATFHPESAQEAADLLASANEYRQKLFITGFGNNIDPVGEKFEKLMTLRTDRLNTMLQIVPEDFYIVVGAGFPLREINRDLKPFGLFLPHSDLPYVGSVGGSLAVGLSAHNGGHSIPLSRYFIKAEIATPEGEVIRPGSVCFKSVSGYDIVKIFAPSWGLLGLIATATLRVLPISIRAEFANIKMSPVKYREFVERFQRPEGNVSAQYSLKIKRKFDPLNILPLIDVLGR